MKKSESILFTVDVADVGAHTFEVQCQLSESIVLNAQEGVQFSLPTWIAGSYLIRDFAKNIVRMSAQDVDGESVEIEQMDKSSWRLQPCTSAVTLTYTVYAFDLSVRTAWLDTERGFFNGTSLFMRIEGCEQLRHRLQLNSPVDKRLSEWRVATSMSRESGWRYEFGEFSCPDYFEFIDHPVEMGDFESREFIVAGVEHVFVITGKQRGDIDRLVHDTQAICTAHVARFGALPMREYWFLLAVVGQGYGGLEHLDSTALLASRDDLPIPNTQKIGKKYRNLLGLISHEYFHSWNVKRIQPAAFAQGNTQTEAYTRLLWAFEGITSYYDDLTLLTAGLISPAEYLECLSRTASAVYKNAGRHEQTLEASSFNAWTTFYQQNENATNAIVSYYTKGALVALMLDLLLREHTDLTLDDVMRKLWCRHGQTREPVPETAIEDLVVEMTGQDFAGYFDIALRSTQDLPLPELLEKFAVQWQVPSKRLASLGLAAMVKTNRLVVTQTFAAGAAQMAGIAVGDELLALDGVRLRHADWQQQVASCAVESQVDVHVFRHDVLHVFSVGLQAAQPDAVTLTLHADSDDKALARRRAWLGGHV